MAEHSAVNRRVVSSSLTWGAKEKRPSCDGRFSFSCTLAYNPRLTAAAETCAEPSARCAGCSEAEARVKQGEKRTVRGFRPCFTMGRVVSSSQALGAN